MEDHFKQLSLPGSASHCFPQRETSLASGTNRNTDWNQLKATHCIHTPFVWLAVDRVVVLAAITFDVTVNLPWVYCLALVAVIQEACITLYSRTAATCYQCFVFLNKNYGLYWWTLREMTIAELMSVSCSPAVWTVLLRKRSTLA